MYCNAKFNYKEGNGSNVAKKEEQDFPCKKDDGLSGRSEGYSMQHSFCIVRCKSAIF